MSCRYLTSGRDRCAVTLRYVWHLSTRSEMCARNGFIASSDPGCGPMSTQKCRGLVSQLSFFARTTHFRTIEVASGGMYLPATSQNTSQASLYLATRKALTAPNTMIRMSRRFWSLRRVRMVQLLLNTPAITLASIKAVTAEAAMATARAMRKSKSSTTMMFFSIPHQALLYEHR